MLQLIGLSTWDDKSVKDDEFNKKYGNRMNSLFSLYFRMEPNKLECCIALGQKGLTKKNTLAYWVVYMAW